jgi:hypothetical protein
MDVFTLIPPENLKNTRQSVRGTNVKISDSVRFLEKIFPNHKATAVPVTFTSGVGSFFVLLSTPNCKSITYMMRDHCNNLGWKAISSMYVWIRKDIEMKSNEVCIASHFVAQYAKFVTTTLSRP